MSRIKGLVDIYDGNKWQQLASELCILKYTVNHFLRVPDQHKGDWGIEGFTLSGLAFQCYAPEKNHPTERLAYHQKRKINSDLNKFVANENSLAKLIPSGKYSRWFFLTTELESKEIPAYCARKTLEVKAKCNHVTDDFAVMPFHGDDFFLEEIPRYINMGKQKFRIPAPVVNQAAINNHNLADPAPMQKIRKKLIDGRAPQGAIDSLVQSYIKDLLVWRTVKEDIKSLSPDLWLLIEEKVSSLENNVLKKYQLTADLTAPEIQRDFENLHIELRAEVSTQLESTAIDNLSRGVIADWLVRCPINF